MYVRNQLTDVGRWGECVGGDSESVVVLCTGDALFSVQYLRHSQIVSPEST